MPSVPSLAELVKSSGLKYVELGSGTLAVPFKAERAEQLVIQVKKVGDDLAFFVVDIPGPGWMGHEQTLYNLLRVTFEANYAKAAVLERGDLCFTAELPAALLTPQIVEGLIRGLAALGDAAKKDLPSWEGWQQRKTLCTIAQASAFKVDVTRARAELLDLARAAGIACEERDHETFKLEWGIGGVDFKVMALLREPCISFVLALGDTRPKGDKKKYMRGLLELNRSANVAKVGLDSDGDVTLLYEVPQLFPDLLEKAKAQLGLLLVGLVALEAGR